MPCLYLDLYSLLNYAYFYEDKIIFKGGPSQTHIWTVFYQG